jgi:hypothetical protein
VSFWQCVILYDCFKLFDVVSGKLKLGAIPVSIVSLGAPQSLHPSVKRIVFAPVLDFDLVSVFVFCVCCSV